MKKILILLSMFFLTMNYVSSADWYANNEKAFLIDKTSISKTKNSVKAWVILVSHGKIFDKKYEYVEQYVDAKCSDRTMAILEGFYYNKKHNSVASYNFEKNNEVEYNRIIPETRGEALFNDLCNMK